MSKTKDRAPRRAPADHGSSEKDRLARMAAFLLLFEDPFFRFGRWEGGEKDEGGSIQMPYYSLYEAAGRFEETAYRDGWILSGFDWAEWKQTPEAEALRDDAKILSEATLDQVSKLLTVLIRQDRFCEGSLAGAFESGLLSSILRRINAIWENSPPA